MTLTGLLQCGLPSQVFQKQGRLPPLPMLYGCALALGSYNIS